MTVVFHTNAGGPVLAADMLLSVTGPTSHTELKLPSQPSGIVIPSNLVPGFIPVKMRRKVFVVNDHLAVGAAGHVSQIQSFVGALTGEFQDKTEYSYREIESFLNRYASDVAGGEVLKDIAALIMARATDWSGSLSIGRPVHKNVTSQRFGKVITVGTGSEAIIEQIVRLDNNYDYGLSQPPDGDKLYPEFRPLAANLTLLANLYWTELSAPANIFDAWGGAYDLIYQGSDGAFRYLDEYTIFVRKLQADQAEMGLQPIKVLRYERRSDVSLISMTDGQRLDFFGALDITATGGPLDVEVGGPGLTFNSKVHISVILIFKGNRFALPFIVVEGLGPRGPANQAVFTDFDAEGRLRLFFRSDLDEWLREQVMSYYLAHADSWS